MGNEKIIELMPASVPGEFQITLLSSETSKHIGMSTRYSVITFETEQEIDELIDALKFVRDKTYKNKARIS